MRGPVILALALALAAGACSNDAPDLTATAVAPDPTATAPVPSLTATAPVPTQEASSEAIPGEEPLSLGISIHVEGWQREDTDRDSYEIHRAALADLGRVAADHGAKLTYELSAVFVRAHEAWGDDFITEMEGLGHAFGVHADVGGRDPSFDAFVEALVSQRRSLEGLGAEVTHVSGICSSSPWVEAAIEAGYLGTTGAVEYCLKSLDTANLPAGKEHVADCRTPTDCHGPSVDDIVQRMHPWRTSDSADWLTPDPDGDLVVVVGESGSSLDCLADGATGAGCTAGPEDVEVFVSRIDEYLAARGPFPLPPSITVSWSIGSIPPEGFAAVLFSAIEPYVTDGSVVWATLPEIVAAAG